MFENKNILIVGDLMLDSYLHGNVERISPEAPVPVVDINKNENKLGGASNVALNIKSLGSTPYICSFIGDDEYGNKLLHLLKKNNIETKYIYKSIHRNTSVKNRIIGNGRQMIRYDIEDKKDILKEEFDNVYKSFKKIIKSNRIDSIIIQDYDKGLLNKKLINKIIDYSINNNIPVLVDPKKKNFNHYKNIKLFKPNFKELKDGLNLNEINIEDKKLLKMACSKLHNRNIEVVFVTMSDKGIYISYNKGESNELIKSDKVNVSDVSGAGDTVISVASTLINSDLIYEDIAYISNKAGGIVCTYNGVKSINKEELETELKKGKD